MRALIPTHFIEMVFLPVQVINPRRACTARVTVVVRVCPLINISPLERLFDLKTIPSTQQAANVKTFVGFCLKPLRCRDPALPLYGHTCSRPFVRAENAHAHYNIYHVVDRSGHFSPCGATGKAVVSFLSCYNRNSCCTDKAETAYHVSEQSLPTISS